MVNPTLTFVVNPTPEPPAPIRLSGVELGLPVPIEILKIQDGQPVQVEGTVTPQGGAPPPDTDSLGLRIRFLAPGRFTYVVSVGNLSRTFTVEVEARSPDPITGIDIQPTRIVFSDAEVRIAVNWIVGDARLPVPRSQQTWTSQNGPLPIANSPNAQTTLQFSQPGTYTYQVTASNGVQSFTQDFTIEVLPCGSSPDEPQLVDPPQEVTLPDVARVPLRVQPEPGINPSWRQLSGPDQADIQYVNVAIATITFPRAGGYGFQVTLGEATQRFCILVQPAMVINQPPRVDAGPDLIVDLPNGAVLQGIVGDDGFPDPPGRVEVRWRHERGGGQVVFSNPNLAETTAIFSDKGRYVLTLTAFDGEATTTDDLIVTVNKAPEIRAIAPAAIVLPDTAILSGQILDNGLGDLEKGTVQGFWAKVSGPGSVTFSPVTSPGIASMTTATFSERGRYELRYIVSNGCLTTVQDVTVVVSLVPLVQAGADQTITLPATALLEGQIQTEEWPSSRPLRVEWLVVDGPGQVSFESQRPRTRARFSTSGSYVLRLSVTDGILTASDDVVITVNPALVVPRVVQDLVVLYTFKEGQGTTLRDVSGVGTPLDLHIVDTTFGRVDWLPNGGLAVREETNPPRGQVPKSPIIQTRGPAAKVIHAVKRTNQLTVEVWYRPGSDRPIVAAVPPEDPIRILSIADRAVRAHTNRNFTLQQGQWQRPEANFYHARLRSISRETSTEEGLKTPAIIQADTTASPFPWKINHIVYTWDGAGKGRLYVDGVLQVEARYPEPDKGWQDSLCKWDEHYQLALAKDPDGRRPGRGEFQLVAIYNRALTADEVAQNFQAGYA